MIDAANYSVHDNLRDGTPVIIRAISRGDGDRIRVAFEHLDREAVYTRFFTYKKSLTDAELNDLTDVDSDHVVALVVTTGTGDDEALIGGGRYCSEAALCASQSAELAFFTDDHYRGRGVASLILKHLIAIARDQGLLQFDADVLAQNRGMLVVFAHSGLAMKQRHEGNVMYVALSLKGDTHDDEEGS